MKEWVYIIMGIYYYILLYYILLYVCVVVWFKVEKTIYLFIEENESPKLLKDTK